MPALLLTVLADAGKSVRYLAGRAVWQASGTYRGGEAKTDAKDARVIADQSRMRGTDLPVLRPDDDLITELRMLTAHRADLVADRTRTINRLRQQLIAVCPALERVARTDPRPRLGGVVVALPTSKSYSPERCFAVDEDPDRCRDCATRPPSPRLLSQRPRPRRCGCPVKRSPPGWSLSWRREVIALDDRIKTTDTDIEGRFRRHPLAEVITSMPGVGFRLGAEFLAAVGDPALISSADQLAAWAGLAPVSKDSGKRTGRLHTPKRYSRRLRRVMYMSALTAIRCDPASKTYYQRKRDEGKRPIPATICLARRRTNVLYALIRDNRTWQPDSPPITNAAA